MIATIEHQSKTYKVNLGQPIDISISLQSGKNNPNAFFINEPLFEPIVAGDFVGSVKAGGAANCENLFLNAHGNGTHTECVGHITPERITINQSLKDYFSVAQLISVQPKQNGQDLVVKAEDVVPDLSLLAESVIIRTLPNTVSKKSKFYSGTNPCYLEEALCRQLAEKNIKHLIIDLPSVDRENDEGKMLSHKAFWRYPNEPRKGATITEMAFIPDEVVDGLYLLNLQIAPIESDASPSKPLLYKIL